jgi:hypothetical protein
VAIEPEQLLVIAIHRNGAPSQRGRFTPESGQLVISCRSGANGVGLAVIIDGGSEKPKVKTLSGRKPGSTLQSWVKLRIISPALMSKTSAIAISTTTNAPWRDGIPLYSDLLP